MNKETSEETMNPDFVAIGKGLVSAIDQCLDAVCESDADKLNPREHSDGYYARLGEKYYAAAKLYEKLKQYPATLTRKEWEMRFQPGAFLVDRPSEYDPRCLWTVGEYGDGSPFIVSGELFGYCVGYRLTELPMTETGQILVDLSDCDDEDEA